MGTSFCSRIAANLGSRVADALAAAVVRAVGVGAELCRVPVDDDGRRGAAEDDEDLVGALEPGESFFLLLLPYQFDLNLDVQEKILREPPAEP